MMKKIVLALSLAAGLAFAAPMACEKCDMNKSAKACDMNGTKCGQKDCACKDCKCGDKCKCPKKHKKNKAGDMNQSCDMNKTADKPKACNMKNMK